ncbi:MAG: metallophosphoesterase [Candidatus Aminicenantes bacterium]|nr:metallophosphoesterase [Candidatus Aminicenantes bacterium]
MKIGLISDTHDRMEVIKWFALEFGRKGVEVILHAGDIIAPFAAKPFSPFKFIAVFGNNCGERLFLRDTIEKFGGEIRPGPIEIELGGKKFFLMHEPFALKAATKSGEYDFIIYGHTHELVKRREGRSWILNPGEACGYLTGKATAMLINTEKEEIEILEYPGNSS